MRALVGLTFVAIVCTGLPGDAVADAVPITVTLEKTATGCKANVAPPTPGTPVVFHLSQAKRQMPVWSFHNKCGSEQRIRVCPARYDPQTDCINDEAKTDDDFALEDDSVGNAACRINWAKFAVANCTPSSETGQQGPTPCPRFHFTVTTAPAGSDIDCSTQRVSELALEVDP